MPNNQADEQRLAVFIDFDNLAIGAREAKYPKFDVNLMLERLLEKGKIVYKNAYADWSRYIDYKRAVPRGGVRAHRHPAAPQDRQELRRHPDGRRRDGPLLSKEHITTFVIASGDSDFSPLVSKLKENDKHVLGFGVKNSTSELLIDNCDEFIYYEDLVREQRSRSPSLDGPAGEDARGLLA